MTANIFITGPIGDPPEDFYEESGTTLVDVRRQYESFSDVTKVNVFINSIGGDVYEGFAIYDFLRSLPVPVTTIGEGKIFSIASVIFLAGLERLMAPNATLLIHDPSAMFWGGPDQAVKFAEDLKAIKDRLINLYVNITGQPRDDIETMVSAETSLTSQDSITLGFATGMYEQMRAVAWINPKITNKTKMADFSKEEKGRLAQLVNKILNLGSSDEPENLPEQEVPETPDEEEGETQESLKAKIETLEAEKAELQKALTTQTSATNQLQEDFETFKKEAATLAKEVKRLTAEVQELEEVPIPISNAKPTPIKKGGFNMPADWYEMSNKLTAKIKGNA